MIQQYRYIMALMNILAHASTLRPKGRGINPVVIQMFKKSKIQNSSFMTFVLDFGSEFEFVSDFVLRISDLTPVSWQEMQ